MKPHYKSKQLSTGRSQESGLHPYIQQKLEDEIEEKSNRRRSNAGIVNVKMMKALKKSGIHEEMQDTLRSSYSVKESMNGDTFRSKNSKSEIGEKKLKISMH